MVIMLLDDVIFASDAPSGRIRDFAIIEKPKDDYYYPVALARQEICRAH
jgi:hypothetical protein